MRLIGMTGRSGSGKSTVGSVALELGIPVLDCDAIYRELTSRPTELLYAIRDTFGDETVRDGALYRPALREKVFADQRELEKLNSLTARFMTCELKERLSLICAPLVILDAPTLFESGLDAICDCLLCVTASDDACIHRIELRDGIDYEAASLRLANQHSKIFFEDRCDIILYNDGERDSFRQEAFAVLTKLQRGEI